MKLRPVHAPGRAGEQLGFLRGRIVLREQLEGIPERAVVASAEIDREVALEHASCGRELLDAVGEKRSHPRRELFRTDGLLAQMPVETAADTDWAGSAPRPK